MSEPKNEEFSLDNERTARRLAYRISEAALAIQIRARSLGRIESERDTRVAPREFEFAPAVLEAIMAYLGGGWVVQFEGATEDCERRRGHPKAHDIVIKRDQIGEYELIVECKRAIAPSSRIEEDLERLARAKSARKKWLLLVGSLDEGMKKVKSKHLLNVISIWPGDATGHWEWYGEGAFEKVTVKRLAIRYHCGPGFLRGNRDVATERVDFSAVYEVS